MKLPPDIIKYCESCYMWDDDLRQELYVKILELPDTAEINKGWCVTAYNNLRVQEGRKESNRNRLLSANEDTIREVFYEHNQGDDPADVLAARTSLTSRLDDLSPLIHDTMTRHYMDGVSVKEIADEEYESEDVIYKRLERGRNILKGASNDR